MPSNLNDPGWDDIFESAGAKYDVDPRLVKALMFTETGAGTDPAGRVMAKSPKGALGPMQLLPSSFPDVDPYDPYEAIPSAARYLSEGLAKYNDPTKALMYYHGGPDEKQWGPLTRAYPNSVARYYQQLQQQGSSTPTDSGSASWQPQVILGDSLAQQANNHAKVGGDFKVGRNAQQVLDSLADYVGANDLMGKNVLLSSGISNAIIAGPDGKSFQGDPTPALPLVEAQLQMLKQAGARPVLMGVGPHPGLSGVNDALQEIAKQYQVPYAPLIGPFEKTNIHPQNGKATLLNATKAATSFYAPAQQ